MNDTHPRERLRVTSPGDELLGCDEVHVGQGEDRVNELEETLLPVGPVEEPGSVEEEGEGGLALGVVLQEVLGENLLDGVGVLVVEAAISHGAGATSATTHGQAHHHHHHHHHHTDLTSFRVFMGTSHMPGWDSDGHGLTEQL